MTEDKYGIMVEMIDSKGNLLKTLQLEDGEATWKDPEGNVIPLPKCTVCNEEVDVLEKPNPHLECIRKKNQRA
jgi:hypothetical protein